MGQEQGIVLFRDNYEHVRHVLSQEQKGHLLDAVFDGAYGGSDPLVQLAFNIFQAAILRSAEKYEATCAKNREKAKIRWMRDKEKEEKAAAYDRLQQDALASDGMQQDALASDGIQSRTTGTYTCAGADAGTGIEENSFAAKQRFSPPQVEEVRAYCRERGNRVDPEQFVDFYAVRGWQLKQGVRMRDWKAAVRTWERNTVEANRNGNVGNHREEDRIPGQRDLYAL